MAADIMADKKKTAGNNECLFSKEQLKASKKFANRKDLVEILLDDNKQYSVTAVENMVEKFMKGRRC